MGYINPLEGICLGGWRCFTFHCTLLRTGTLTLLKQLNVAETLESDVVAYGASVREVINLWKVICRLFVLCPSQMSYSNCIKTCQKNNTKLIYCRWYVRLLFLIIPYKTPWKSTTPAPNSKVIPFLKLTARGLEDFLSFLFGSVCLLRFFHKQPTKSPYGYHTKLPGYQIFLGFHPYPALTALGAEGPGEQACKSQLQSHFWLHSLSRWFEIFLIFTPTWGNDPNRLICFNWVETTNQLCF